MSGVPYAAAPALPWGNTAAVEATTLAPQPEHLDAEDAWHAEAHPIPLDDVGLKLGDRIEVSTGSAAAGERETPVKARCRPSQLVATDSHAGTAWE